MNQCIKESYSPAFHLSCSSYQGEGNAALVQAALPMAGGVCSLRGLSGAAPETCTELCHQELQALVYFKIPLHPHSQKQNRGISGGEHAHPSGAALLMRGFGGRGQQAGWGAVLPRSLFTTHSLQWAATRAG